ncbi:MAG: hypothetical protein Q4C82_00020 [Eubacteriales bacterium]|nr:hypothetical protein [Eubacteriales bacterium]
MQERYGNVTLIYEEAETALQAPSPEDARIEGLVDGGFDCKRAEAPDWAALYHLSHLRANLTEWLPIGAQDTVLEFGADTGQLTGGFAKKAGRTVCVGESLARGRILAKRHREVENLTVYAGDPWKTLERLGESFDWIVAPGLLAQAGRYFKGDDPKRQALERLLRYRKAGGRIVLAADNRFGLKYWAGAADPATGRYFDGPQGRGEGLSRRELQELLEKSGLGDALFYYPYPERWFPSSLYSDRWLPKAGELNRNLRNFEGERLLLFDEERVYDELIRDGRFPEFSNAFLVVAGAGEEELPLYVKYSNDRAERFMIRTDIAERDGRKVVRKLPVSEEAVPHVQAMKRWEEELERQWGACGLHFNRCGLSDGAACFEFLKGQTLEERLDGLRSRKDYAGLTSALLDYRRLLTACAKGVLQPFEKSARFVEMFGNPEFSKAYEGTRYTNLDWIFGNLMETADGVQVFDYEWTFEVQVPTEYLLWRALSLYLNSREELQGLGFMAQLGISSEEERIFGEMEHHFQRWLLDGTVTIGEQYLHTAGETLPLPELLRERDRLRMQIYADCGAGFSEADSFWIRTEPDKEGLIRLTLLLPAGTRALRIDPAEGPCIVKVKRLLGELGGTYGPAWSHNGRELEREGILYTTDDPQITVSGIVEGTDRLYAELTVQPMAPDAAYACMNLLNRVRTAERIYQSAPFRLLKKLKRTGK